MLSIDTNILFHALNENSPKNDAAYFWIKSISLREDVAISEFILAELYGLLRNSAVLKYPLNADEAVNVIDIYRHHPKWRIIGFPSESREMHNTLWNKAREKTFAFRKLYDTRSALTMMAQGVKEFATLNEKDFAGIGFEKVWNPIA